ncbi:MAG: hypothetical protein HMLKMBBP_01058 [Planctomycetes bacterium]|nr:hypothetical protein [Planctomycetota bacterium]
MTAALDSGATPPQGPAEAVRRATAFVRAAFAAGLLLRLVVALKFARFSSGDELWYRDMAHRIVSGEPVWFASDDHLRGPGTPGYVALVWTIAGSESLAAVRFVNALLLSSTPLLCAALARRLFPAMPFAAAAAAWLAALNPVELRFVQVVMSESLVIPLCLGWLLALLELWRAPRAAPALTAAALGAALIHVRHDSAAVVAAVCVAGFVAALIRGAPRARAAAAWIGTAALAIALCIPWSVFASRRFGRPLFVCHTDPLDAEGLAHRRGWNRWLATTYRPRKEWLRLWWWGYAHGDVVPAWLHDDLFDGPDEREKVLAWLAEGRAAGGMNPVTEAKFQALGDERAARHPVRFWVGYPLLRIGNVWFHPTDDDFPAHMEPTQRGAASTALEVALRTYRVLFGLGLLAVVVMWFRWRRITFLPASLVLLRTAQMAWGPQIAWGLCMSEIRYVAPVQPVALVFLAGAAGMAVGRFRGADRTLPLPSAPA